MMKDNVKSIDVINGVHLNRLPLAGKTIGEIRHQRFYPLQIHPDAVGFVDGVEADDETVLIADQTLSFVVHAGEMG